MKRVITASLNQSLDTSNKSVESLLTRLSSMRTDEILQDREAIEYCYKLQDLVRVAALAISEECGWDDTSSEIIKRNDDDLMFLTRGSVYTKNKRLLDSICDNIEAVLESKTPFKDSIDISYYRDYDNPHDIVYIIVASGTVWMDDLLG